jgi:hypothetical protein
MTAGQKDKSSAPLVAVFVVLLTIAPLLYVLSIGPALLLLKERVISERTWQRIYVPVVWPACQTKVTREALFAYMKLWMEEGSQSPPAGS